MYLMNEMSSDDKIRSLLNKLNIVPNKFDIYRTAFTHQSYSNEHGVESNERLEYLGDAILDFLIAEFLFHKFPNEPEGTLTKIRAKYVCAKANGEYAMDLGLDSSILLGKGESEQGGRQKQSLLADLFESFLGAVYLDNGIEKVEKILEEYVYSKISSHSVGFTDFKSKLQEFVQAESRRSVEYQLIKEFGPAHDKTFTVVVTHEKVRLGEGVGKSKKEAEQNAAEDALTKLALND